MWLSPMVVLQLYINELLPLIIDKAPLSLKLSAHLRRCDRIHDPSREIIDLLRKSNIVLVLL